MATSFDTIWDWYICILTGERSPDINHIYMEKCGSTNGLHCPALFFVFIFMHDREEWDLV